MNEPGIIYLKDYSTPDHTIEKLDLEFNLKEDVTTVKTKMKVKSNKEGVTSFVLNGKNLKTEWISVDGTILNQDQYKIENNLLTLSNLPDNFIFESEVTLFPSKNSSLEGVYKSGTLLCTQCEAQGFRRITWFPDRPDVMTSFTTKLIASIKDFPILLSNGNLVDNGENGDGTHFAVWNDPHIKPSYLFALVAGDLVSFDDTFTTRSDKSVALKIYVEKKDIDKCDHAMYALKSAMKWDEENYNREYDLDIYMIVAVDSFNAGAMENKGLNIFNSKYVLARPDTATDADYEGILGVIAHEYFHNWTGNRVTLRDWFHLSLKEGLTVFRDQEFTSDKLSRGVKRVEDARIIGSIQFAEDSGPMSHPVRPDSFIEINNFYTVTVYQKGAEIIRMEETLIGRDNFKKGMDLYFERHDGTAVIIEDFVKAMADVSGFDFSQFMNWYSQSGTPRVDFKGEYDKEKQIYTLKVDQFAPDTLGENQLFHIPIAIGLVKPGHGDLPLILEGDDKTDLKTTTVLHVKKAHSEFKFLSVPCCPVPSLLRGFSAPVKITHNLSDDDLILLMGEDTDLYVKWESGQTLATNIILEAVKNSSLDEINLKINPNYIDALKKLINDKELDGSFVSLMFTLPSETWLWEQTDLIEVNKIHKARLGLKKSIARELKPLFEELYNRVDPSEGSLDFDAACNRRLRNTILSYLVLLDSDKFGDIAFEQFNSSKNMTNELAALSILSNMDSPHRETALELFYNKWKNEFLLVNKWFAIQALSDLPSTLEIVKSLMEHPAFDRKNPNNIRALLGSFGANKIHFHREDGKGYKLLTDEIIKLNEINPIIASRLITPLTRWKKHTPGRQKLMKEQLHRILDLSDLSKDLFEIVGKSLKY
jgi:aminopeptidase N